MNHSFKPEDLQNAKGFSVQYPDYSDLITPAFAKSLRKNLQLTQLAFSTVLGVSKKTIEKWEQGGNPIQGTAARLLYLLNLHPEWTNELVRVNGPRDASFPIWNPKNTSNLPELNGGQNRLLSPSKRTPRAAQSLWVAEENPPEWPSQKK